MKLSGNNKHPLAAGPRLRGFALVMVLWFVLLMTVMALGVVGISRSSIQMVKQHIGVIEAKYLAQAGMELVMANLMMASEKEKLLGSGHAYKLTFDEGDVRTVLQDETGKIDINTANEELLSRFFALFDVGEEKSQFLAGAIADWRDADSLVRAHGAEQEDYLAAGLSYGPANKAFPAVSVLRRLIGMEAKLFAEIEPYLTVHSKSQGINPRVAPLLTLLAASDASPEVIATYIDQRQQNYEAGLEAPAAPSVPAHFLSRNQGNVFSLIADARTVGGVSVRQKLAFRVKNKGGRREIEPLDFQPHAAGSEALYTAGFAQ